MKFLIISSFILMFISVTSNSALRGIRGRIGRVRQIEDIKAKFRAYTKVVSPFAMILATIFLFAATHFNLTTLILFLVAISAYAWSAFVAWKQYMLEDEGTKNTNQRMIASLTGNILTIFIFYSNLSFLIE